MKLSPIFRVYYCYHILVVLVSHVLLRTQSCHALNVVLAGGSGPIAAATNRVTETFGWVGEGFLKKHRRVRLRDWDGGDLLDIVGKDWIGWQEDTLAKADVIVHLVGGFTEQRLMACERLVRESMRVNPKALHITVNPTLQDLPILSPGMVDLKSGRISKCEEMVTANCANTQCLRIEANRIEQGCDAVYAAIAECV